MFNYFNQICSNIDLTQHCAGIFFSGMLIGIFFIIAVFAAIIYLLTKFYEEYYAEDSNEDISVI